MDRTLIENILKEIRLRGKDFKNNSLYHKVLNDNLKEVLADEVFSKMETEDGKKDKRNMSVNINFLKKIVTKLSQLYTATVERNFVNSTDKDKEIAAYYMKTMQLDKKLQKATMLYNGTKSVLLELIYNKQYKLGLRVIPNDSYFLYSDDPDDQDSFSHVIKILEKKFEGHNINYVYQIISENQIVKISSTGGILEEKVNELGFLPFIHVNSEEDSIFPSSDYDTLSTLLQVNSILTDSVVTTYWQAFPIIYGTNIDVKNTQIDRNPGSFHVLNPPAGSILTPSITISQPSLQVAPVMQLAESILRMVYDSKGIKSASGDSSSKVTSGVQAIIDAVDTSEVRKIIANDWAYAEEELWQLISKYHRWLVINKPSLLPRKTPKTFFSDNFEVIVDFPLVDNVINSNQNETNNQENLDEVDNEIKQEDNIQETEDNKQGE